MNKSKKLFRVLNSGTCARSWPKFVSTWSCRSIPGSLSWAPKRPSHSVRRSTIASMDGSRTNSQLYLYLKGSKETMMMGIVLGIPISKTMFYPTLKKNNTMNLSHLLTMEILKSVRINRTKRMRILLKLELKWSTSHANVLPNLP